jgi:hypothetical protein
LLKKALALSEKERAVLASTLIESLDDTVDETRKPLGKKRSSVASKKFDPGKRRRPLGTTFARRGVRY